MLRVLHFIASYHVDKERAARRLACFTSRKLADRVVYVKRLSDAIAVLNVFGEGVITMEARLEYGDPRPPRTSIPIHHLQNKSEDSIWWLFDSQIDVSRVRDIPYQYPNRKVDPANRGRWPNCPVDIRNVLDGVLPDRMYRLRHFGALMILDIKIRKHFYSIPQVERAMIDAGIVDEDEKIIAHRAMVDVGLKDLLYLR